MIEKKIIPPFVPVLKNEIDVSYFDPVNFAPFISCPVLVGFNQNSTISPAQCVYNLISQLRVSNKDIHISKEGLNTLEKGFYGLKETWLKERLR